MSIVVLVFYFDICRVGAFKRPSFEEAMVNALVAAEGADDNATGSGDTVDGDASNKDVAKTVAANAAESGGTADGDASTKDVANAGKSVPSVKNITYKLEEEEDVRKHRRSRRGRPVAVDPLVKYIQTHVNSTKIMTRITKKRKRFNKMDESFPDDADPSSNPWNKAYGGGWLRNSDVAAVCQSTQMLDSSVLSRVSNFIVDNLRRNHKKKEECKFLLPDPTAVVSMITDKDGAIAVQKQTVEKYRKALAAAGKNTWGKELERGRELIFLVGPWVGLKWVVVGPKWV